MLVVGALRSTSKDESGAELELVDAGGALAAVGGAWLVIAGTGLPKRFPLPANGPGGGGT